ncbi:FecCD family ABC transporter permease [Flaviflexus massiliensis]|uniref:FecCD family ABC transporter permease n=1 Tax=Flaviflexus massiliensis TaxID=1522309 RepID=UPI000A492593|nr:iron ABC transporter permease [Flaviflexus massiliensis]
MRVKNLRRDSIEKQEATFSEDVRNTSNGSSVLTSPQSQPDDTSTNTPSDSGNASDSGDLTDTLRKARRSRIRRRSLVTVVLVFLVAGIYLVNLMWGEVVYSPADVSAVIRGEDVQGASYSVGVLRLPRATMGLLAGIAFGAAGVTFQTMLRNQLASPDIIGISSGASAAGVIGIVIFGMGQTQVSIVALIASLTVALLIYLLSYRGGFAGTRLILIGIGFAALLQSVVTYALSQASSWDLPTATRWLTGSLNGATWERTGPLAATALALLPIMLLFGRNLNVLRLGDETARGLGVRVNLTRVVMIVCAVILIAVATSACGPIAFVAFVSGPIAARIVGPGGSLTIPAALVGALVVLVSDLVSQYFLGVRYPVGVLTGALGAPFLIYLLARSNRGGNI